MTELKSKMSYVGVIFMLLINIFVLVVAVNNAWEIVPVIIILLFINLFYWLFSFSGQYSVFLEAGKLIIRNNLRLFFEKEISLDEIKDVNRVQSTFYGIAIKIRTQSEREYIYSVNTETKKMDDFIDSLKGEIIPLSVASSAMDRSTKEQNEEHNNKNERNRV